MQLTETFGMVGLNPQGIAFRDWKRRAVTCLLSIISLKSCASLPPTRMESDPTLVGQEFAGALAGSTVLTVRMVNTPGDVEYGLHHLNTHRGERLLLTSSIGRDSSGTARYRILTAVVLPARRSNETVVIGACSIEGILDVDIIAIARLERKPELSRIVRAWRANGPNASIEPITTDGIKCENERWSPS